MISTWKNQGLKAQKTLICFLNSLFIERNKKNHTCRGYATSYKVGIASYKLVEKKDPIKQLEATRSSIKDSFNDILSKTK